jgi:membrane-bound ClpP family serine protease
MRLDAIPIGPTATLVLFVAGVLLVYWEMCRPGMVLPGIGGLTLTILCALKLRTAAPTRGAVVAAAIVLGMATVALGSAAVLGFLRKRDVAGWSR